VTDTDTLSVAEVAVKLGISEPTVRRAIAKDTAENLPDERRRVPGGRVINTRYWVYRAIFETVTNPQPRVIHPFVQRRQSA